MRAGLTATLLAGDGPPLVLVHGWGMHSGIWHTVAGLLARSHRVIGVDLPGYGASAGAGGPYGLDSAARLLAAVVPEGAVLVGWSLGGLVAMQTACSLQPRLAGLVLVAGTPRFVEGGDWPHGMSLALLAGFAAELQTDFRAALMRFLALQTRGSEHAREDLRRLRSLLCAGGEPVPAALAGGLGILAQADLRAVLPALELPTLWIMGARDTLVPPAAAKAAAAIQPNARVEIIPGAGHAPFLSHPQAFAAALQGWLDPGSAQESSA